VCGPCGGKAHGKLLSHGPARELPVLQVLDRGATWGRDLSVRAGGGRFLSGRGLADVASCWAGVLNRQPMVCFGSDRSCAAKPRRKSGSACRGKEALGSPIIKGTDGMAICGAVIFYSFLVAG
jgi:hypothetical protein